MYGEGTLYECSGWPALYSEVLRTSIIAGRSEGLLHLPRLTTVLRNASAGLDLGSRIILSGRTRHNTTDNIIHLITN